jgi:hypothetical protein
MNLIFAFVFLFSLNTFAQNSAVGNVGTQSMNPDFSAIIDGTGGFYQRRPISLAGDDPDFGGDSQTKGGGFTLQEAELAISSNVDPYFRGDLYLTIPNQGKLEVEEGFLTTTALPFDLQLKAGKFRSSVGRQNGQHLHVQDFTRRPLINQNFLGVDGLSAPGVQVSWLVPLPFYSLLAVEGLSQSSLDDPLGPVQSFGGGDKGDLTSAVTLKNFFPVGEEISIYHGLSYTQGRSSTALDPIAGARAVGNNSRTKVYGTDLYIKYKPANAAGGFHSLSFQAEYYQRHFDGTELFNAQNDGGIYAQLVYQLAQRWFLGLRSDFLGMPASQFVKPEQRYSSSLTFAATEFSRVRLYAEEENATANDFASIYPTTSFATFLQLEISMGAHGAHAF